MSTNFLRIYLFFYLFFMKLCTEACSFFHKYKVVPKIELLCSDIRLSLGVVWWHRITASAFLYKFFVYESQQSLSTLDAAIVDNGIDEWFGKFRIKGKPRRIFHRLWEYINSLGKACFYRVERTNISFYCPECVFILLFPRKSLSFIYLTTDSATINSF